MPNTQIYGWPFESPGDQPGISITGGSTGTSEILAPAVEATVSSIDARVSANEAAIAIAQDRLTDFTPVYGRVERSGPQTLTNNSTTKIQANSIVYQSHSMWSAVNFEFTIPAGGDGLYNIAASVSYQGNATGRRSCDIESSSGRLVTELNFSGVGAAVRMTASTQYRLNAGDTVWFTGFQQSGGNLDVLGSANDITHLAIARISPLT